VPEFDKYASMVHVDAIWYLLLRCQFTYWDKHMDQWSMGTGVRGAEKLASLLSKTHHLFAMKFVDESLADD
jgi:hypothetical protein